MSFIDLIKLLERLMRGLGRSAPEIEVLVDDPQYGLLRVTGARLQREGSATALIITAERPNAHHYERV